MKDRPDGRVPQRRPDSIWERYLTGKLSLEDKETLPALIKELHQEIAQHLGINVDAKPAQDVAPLGNDGSATLPPTPRALPMIDIDVRRAHMTKRYRIDPRQN